MRTRFLSIAANELVEALARYRAIDPVLADRFLMEVEAALSRIQSHPLAWTPVGTHLRRCRTRGFPYGLIFTLEGNDILVVAVAHLQRDPRHWRDRLQT